jgi:hypothetical protein
MDETHQQIIRCSEKDLEKIKRIAVSRTAGIWRIKRAKIILGTIEGKNVDKLVLDVRVPPDSIKKCLKEFIQKGLRYFEKPERKPTSREAAVEKMLAFLENSLSPQNTKWDRIIVRYIGIYFTARQIKELRDLIESNPHYTLAEIARQACLLFNLYQQNGMMKKSTLVTILKRMDMDNIIILNHKCSKKYKKEIHSIRFVNEPLPIKTFKKHELEPLRFISVRTKEDSILWNTLIKSYHYINQYRIYGTQMRYLVYGGKGLVDPIYISGNHVKNEKDCYLENFQKEFKKGASYKTREGYLIALLGFGPSAWRLTSRDNYIGWNDEQRIANLHLVVNNVRFLILPWIKSPNLASRILSGITKQLPMDWEAHYNFKPVLLETFVQLDRFKGTCYKAANWIQIGTTHGYNLINREKKNVPTKAIFVYPLNKSFHRILCNI